MSNLNGRFLKKIVAVSEYIDFKWGKFPFSSVPISSTGPENWNVVKRHEMLTKKRHTKWGRSTTMSTNFL